MAPSPDRHTLEGIIERVSFKNHEKFGPTTSLRFKNARGVAYVMGITGTFPFMAGNKVKVSYMSEDTSTTRVLIADIEMYNEKGICQFKINKITLPISLVADIY